MRPTRFYSTQQEKKVAKTVSGKRTANSGATKWSKGDVVTDRILFECKTHTEFRKSFTVQHEWFEKNREEAFAMHKDYSVVVIDFGDGEQHYIIDEQMFKILLDCINKEQ